MTKSTHPSAAPAAASLRSPRSGLSAFVGLTLLALAVVVVAPLVQDTYTVNILIRSLLYATIALTVDILWGYTGILTFGQSAFFGIGAYALGLVSTHLGFGPGMAALAMVAGVVVAAAVAALTGWLAFGYGVPQLYVSVVTLVLPIVVTQLVFSGGSFTGSSSGLSGFETFDLSLEQWFWIAGTGLVLLTAGAWKLTRSDGGRLLVALRENDQRCAYLGIDTAKIRILLMVVAAVIAAVAGYAYAGFTSVVAPELTGFVFGTEIVIWVALGGRGTLLGPVLGTIIIDVTSAYLSGSLPFVWQLLIGVAFVIVIVFLPRGLLPVCADLWRRMHSKGGTAERPVPALQAVDAGRRAQGNAATAVVLSGVARSYGSLQVLRDISFEARTGELLSLIGPNGAGKTTLMRCISDGHERSSGTIAINGHSVGRKGPEHAVRHGLGRKFQMANVFDSLTVAECLRLARFRFERPSFWGRADTLALPSAALRVIEATGLSEQLGVEVKHLSHGQKQALELSMVLALEPDVILLDEPTAGLTKPERHLIGSILVDLTRNHGLCALLVEHDLDFVRDISSRVIVMHQGQIVLDGTVADVVGSELVKVIYSGEEAHA